MMIDVRLGLACGFIGLLLTTARADDRVPQIETRDLQKAKGAVVTLQVSAEMRMPWEQSYAPADRRLLERWLERERAARQPRPAQPHAVTGFVIEGGDKPRILALLNRNERAADSLRVVMGTGSPLRLTVLAWDAESDLVVLEVPNDQSDSQPPANAEQPILSLGDTPAPWGSPIRVLSQWRPGSPSISAGIVATETNYDRSFGAEVFQTDAIVQFSSRGAPVLDSSGRIVGIIAAPHDVRNGEGLVTALGLEAVRHLVDFVRDGGKGAVPKARLGVQLSANAGGAVIMEILDGSPAQKAGIQNGDRIISIGPQRISDPLEVTAAVKTRRPGDELEFTVQRGDETMQLIVTLDESPVQSSEKSSVTSEPAPALTAPVVPLPQGVSPDQLRERLERELYAPPFTVPAPSAVAPPVPPVSETDLRKELEAINNQLRQLNEQVQQLQKKASDK